MKKDIITMPKSDYAPDEVKMMIDKSGKLLIRGSDGTLTLRYCPIQTVTTSCNQYCGEWCPLFFVDRQVSGIVVVRQCHGRSTSLFSTEFDTDKFKEE